jgi:hypothetical protein
MNSVRASGMVRFHQKPRGKNQQKTRGILNEKMGVFFATEMGGCSPKIFVVAFYWDEKNLYFTM